jgi:hypothetical protein
MQPLPEGTGALEMSFIDFVRLEGVLVLDVLTSDSAGLPTNADTNPVYTIYSSDRQSVLVSSGTTVKQSGETGVYVVAQPVKSADGFAAGQTYALLAKWAIGGQARQKMYTFKVD